MILGFGKSWGNDSMAKINHKHDKMRIFAGAFLTYMLKSFSSRYALPRKRHREKQRSPSCDTASTIASIPYVPQISKEGLLKADFVTWDLLTGLPDPGLKDLWSSNFTKSIQGQCQCKTQQDFILSSNAISFVGPTLGQCHARNAQHIHPCHTIVFQKYSYLYLQINA